MNGYVALKNATFNGVEYLAGSIIPEEAVLPSRVPALLRNKIITKAETASQETQDGSDSPETGLGVILPIQTENGVMELSATSEDIVDAVIILQRKQEDAISGIASIESENALIIIDACTKTQAVKKAVRERVAALQKEDGE